MNSLFKIKIATLISFLSIIIPGKLSIPNGVGIIISIIENIYTVFSEQKDIHFFLTTLTFISIFLFFFKMKHLVMLAILIQWFWIMYYFKINYIYYWYYTIPTLIYFILSILLGFKCYSKSSI